MNDKQAPLTDAQKQAVYGAVTEALGDAYDCLRVWSAWVYGTMSEDDFRLVSEDGDRVAEIADAAIAALSRTAPPAEPNALQMSIAELDALLDTDCCEVLTPSQSESIGLVLHELKRIRAAPAAQAIAEPVVWMVNGRFIRFKESAVLEQNAMGGEIIPLYATPVASAAPVVPDADKRDAERIYQANPRGIGSDWTPGCMVCGGEDGLHTNCSFFVPSRETGEALVSLFKSGATLDYRPREPNWIQVKIGVCATHKPNLEALVASAREEKGISIAMIDASIAAAPKDPS
jgi:hypothetical protein